MSKFILRHATPADEESIIQFLNIYWGSEHPLVNNEDFFHYYYKKDDTLQFCLAIDEEGIAAVCGYILANAQTEPDVWVSIWCARKNAKGAGLELMGEMKNLTHCRVLACNNIRENTMAFYTFLGYTALRLPHYYRLADKETYTVARIVEKEILPVLEDDSSLPLVLIPSATILNEVYAPNTSLLPYKDIWYITRRYFHYPMQELQQYKVYGVQEKDGRVSALLVLRAINVEGTTVLRIVDYIGEPDSFGKLGAAIQTLLHELDAEYIDMYCYGIAEEILNAAGLALRECEDGNIIPNYLNPPLYENTEYFFFTSHAEGFTMFKADGDQDRPNI